MRSFSHAGSLGALLGALILVVAVLVLPSPAVARALTRPTFSAPVEVYVGRDPFRVVASDFNGDGRPDLATADNGSGEVSVALGRGDGSFRAIVRSFRTPPETADLAVADLDGDGRPDLVASSGDPHGSVTVFLNRGGGRFRRAAVMRTGAIAPAVALADVNLDGRPDVLTANLGKRDLAVLLNQGSGRLTPARRVGGGVGATDIDVGDVNGDGDTDVVLATAEWGRVVEVLQGAGDGSFMRTRTFRNGLDPDGLTLADLDGDGHLDLAVTDAEAATVSALRGRGDGTFVHTFRYIADGSPEAVVAADFNLDGIPDLASSSTELDPTVASGRGDGTFGGYAYLRWLYYQGAATADFNLDGRPDLAFAATGPHGASEADVHLNWTGLRAAPCVVIDLREYALRKAKHYLHDSSCRLGLVHHRFSRRVGKGRVISETPRIGSVLPAASPVDLVLSRGPHGARPR